VVTVKLRPALPTLKVAAAALEMVAGRVYNTVTTTWGGWEVGLTVTSYAEAGT
jgi:hypothetical protein